MHEVGLMQTALELAEEQARSRRATRIHAITLRVGKLAGVEPEALRFAFDALAAGTMAEGAMLVIESVSAVCFCSGCGAEFTPLDFVFVCSGCGALSSDLRAGADLELASLEVSSDEG